MIGATTPGRSRTHARATTAGVTPSPLAAVCTASTTPRVWSPTCRPAKRANSSEASRESADTVVR